MDLQKQKTLTRGVKHTQKNYTKKGSQSRQPHDSVTTAAKTSLKEGTGLIKNHHCEQS